MLDAEILTVPRGLTLFSTGKHGVVGAAFAGEHAGSSIQYKYQLITGKIELACILNFRLIILPCRRMQACSSVGFRGWTVRQNLVFETETKYYTIFFE